MMAELDRELAGAQSHRGSTSTPARRHVSRGPSWAARTAARLEELPLEGILQVLLALLVIGAVLAIGGVHPVVLSVLGAVASAALFVAFGMRAERRRLPLGGPTLVLWGLAAFCVVQLIPLPLRVVELISPGAADVWARSLLPLELPAARLVTLSLDPGATAIEAQKWWCYGAVFAASSVLASRVGAAYGISLVFLTAVIAAACTVLHGLLGLERVFGIYEPSFRPQPWHIGPLLNPNNLAGLLNLGALSGLGLLLEERPPVPRWLAGVGVAALVGVNVTAASRGGVLMLVIGVVTMGILAGRLRMRNASPRGVKRARWLVVGAIGFGVALALMGATQKSWAELFDENLEKLQMVQWTRPLMREFSIFGIGRGAFESVFPAYQNDAGNVVYTHAENFIAQWLSEWGIPVTVAALFALAWYLRPARLGVGSGAATTGAWLGAAVLVVQNLGDLGLEIPALCIALAVTLGTLWGERARLEPTTLGRAVRGPAAIRWAAATCAIGLTLSAGTAYAGRHRVQDDRRALRRALGASVAPRTLEQRNALRAQLASAMRRHPAEPYFPLLGAVLAWEENDRAAIAWLQRTLERSRANGKAHILLAQVLARYGAREQALMELRLAVVSEPPLVDEAAKLAVTWANDVTSLARAVPANPIAAKAWQSMGAHHADREVARACDREAVLLDPRLVGSRIRLGNDLIRARVEKRGCSSDEARCAAELEQHARSAEEAEPGSSQGGQLRARWLAAVGRHEDAERLLSELCDDVNDRVACAQARARIAADLVPPEPLTQAGRSLLVAACVEEEPCAEMATWLGDLHAGRSEWGAAVNHYQRAVLHVESDDRWLKLARAAGAVGMGGQALRALERVRQRRGGHDAALDEQIREQRRKVMNGVVEQR